MLAGPIGLCYHQHETGGRADGLNPIIMAAMQPPTESRTDPGHPSLLLAADIGGTKANLALFFGTADGLLRRERSVTYPTAAFTTPVAIVERFFHETGTATVAAACLGVAGPVIDGVVRGANLPWPVELATFQQRFHPAPFTLINDLIALAHALPHLADEQLLALNSARPATNGNIGLIAAGTGLGEALLVWDGTRYVPCPSEGGHKDFAARNETQWRLRDFLARQYEGRVSVERTLSGRGLYDLYRFCKQEIGTPEPEWLTVELAAGDPAAVISGNAIQGRDPECVKALDLLIEIFGAEAGNLALQAVATGGIYIGGGIAPKIAPALTTGKFMKAFGDKGRLRNLLDLVPVRLVTDPTAALFGAAACAARQLFGT